jgi:sn-glycerol 3-phosphate transport system substrate-binding protein
MRLVLLIGLFIQVQLWGAPRQLTFWHSMTGEKGKLLVKLVEEFNRLPENVGQVEIRPQFAGSYEEGLNKIRTALLAGQGPHIAQITDIGTQVMIDTKAVAPLQNFIDQDPTFPLKQLLLPIRRYYEVNGKLFSLPFATSNPILYYNLEAFEKVGLDRPPKTFSELKEWARRLTDPKQGKTGLTWPLSSWFFEQFIARQGQVLVNQSNGRTGRATEALYLTPQAIRFATLWKEMCDSGIFANVGRGWDPAEANFLAGRSAMMLHSTSDVFEVVRKATFRVGTAPIPLADGVTTGGTVVGGNSLWILKDKAPADVQASYRFVRYMASQEVQKRWHMGTGYFPIREDLIEELEREGFYKKFPAAKTAIEQLKNSAVMAATQGALMGVFAEARDNLETAMERILAGRMSVEQALKRAKFQTDDALRRYNRFLEKLK